MALRSVWAVYFSPTGTTRYTARRVARGLAESLGASYSEHDFTLPSARRKALAFTSGDLVVLGVPVYAGRVPNVLLPYLNEQLAGGGSLAVPVVLFGNRAFDHALAESRGLLLGRGFRPIAAGAFVGSHAFSPTLAAGRPDRQDQDLMDSLVHATARKLGTLAGAPAEPFDLPGSWPPGPYYTPRSPQGEPLRFLKAKPRTDPHLCTGCGQCAALCPMGSIDETDPAHVPGMCIKCCACIKGCPTGAKALTDPAFLCHKEDLERTLTCRAQSRIFL